LALMTPFCWDWPPGGGGGGGPGIAFCARSEGADRKIARNVSEKTRRREILVAGREVARLGINGKGRKPLRRVQLDLDLAPSAVMRVIARSVSKNILVP